LVNDGFDAFTRFWIIYFWTTKEPNLKAERRCKETDCYCLFHLAFSATLFVGLTTLRWWYVDKAPPIRKTDSYKPEPERTAEDYPLLGVDLD
jgi:hypothetical protein